MDEFCQCLWALGMDMKCIQHLCLPSDSWQSNDTISYQTAILALQTTPQQHVLVMLVDWIVINTQASWTEMENNAIHSLISLAGQRSVQAIILFDNNLSLSDQLNAEWKDDLTQKMKWLHLMNAVCSSFIEDFDTYG